MNIAKKIKVIHFVTGGFTGSTAIAIELVKSTRRSSAITSLLVLRKKSSTNMLRVNELISAGTPVALVPGWSHIATIVALVRLCREYQPDIIVCHGFSEHLWGRYAGLLAHVPCLVHVEHNSQERYTPWKLLQARWLAKYTSKIIGCSEGVRQNLMRLQFPHEKIIAIDNGINLSEYREVQAIPFSERQPSIVMAARFSKQKDHITLIHAIELLRKDNLFPVVYFAGAGSKRHMKKARTLVEKLQLQDQINFLGYCDSVPKLLLENQICVLSTRYEGMPLFLCEGMAAGCAVVGSCVVGVKELIRDGEDGLLVDPQSPTSMAQALTHLLTSTAFASQLAEKARFRALRDFDLKHMVETYDETFLSMVNSYENAIA